MFYILTRINQNILKAAVMSLIDDNWSTFNMPPPSKSLYLARAKKYLAGIQINDDILTVIAEYAASLILVLNKKILSKNSSYKLDGYEFDKIKAPIKFCNKYHNSQYPIDKIVIFASIKFEYVPDKLHSHGRECAEAYSTYYDLLSDLSWHRRMDTRTGCLIWILEYDIQIKNEFPRDGYLIIDDYSDDISPGVGLAYATMHYREKFNYILNFQKLIF